VILNELVIPIGQRDKTLPRAVCQVIDLSLALKAKERYPSAVEMLQQFKQAIR
jgi:hypothetical protein